MSFGTNLRGSNATLKKTVILGTWEVRLEAQIFPPTIRNLSLKVIPTEYPHAFGNLENLHYVTAT